MDRLSKRALFCGVAAIALAATSGVAAQQAANGTTPSASRDSGNVETVVVTASRRPEAAQNVGGGLTALAGADLAQMHAHSFADFANTVPSLSYESGGPTDNLIVIRGVTTGGTQLGSAVGLYVDDVPVGTSTQFGLGVQSFNVNLFDMDRVEVLDGPQGTLYGANALGGALKYVTAAPDPNSYDARAEIEGSSTAHSSYNDGLRVMANVPMFDGQAALRVDGIQEYDSGYAQDPNHGRRNVGAGRTYGGRASFLAEITPDLNVRLSVVSQNIAANGDDVSFRNFLTHQPVQGPYDQSFALAQPADNSLNLYSAVANWDLHWATLTSVTGYQYNHGSYLTDVTPLYDFLLSAFGVGATPFGLDVHTNTSKFTQEVRLASPDNKTFEWVVGGFYTREITDESVDLIDGATSSGKLPGYNVLPFFGSLPSTYKELAVFADGTYYVTDRLDVTLGIRYSNQQQDYQSYNSTLLLFPNYATVYHYQNTSNQDVATYLINPRYHLTDDTMVYARVSSGYRPGGPNFVLPAALKSTAPPTFRSDTLWNYELGEKSTLFDGKGLLNFDIYDIEWDAIQTTANFGGINQLVNAGNARIEGAEMSFDYRILPELKVGGSASYTNAFLTTPSPVLGVTNKGARLPLSARYNFALDGTYAFDLGGGYSGAFNVADVWVGERNAGYNVSPASLAVGRGTPLYKLAAYNTVNTNLSLYLAGNVELDAYVKNVFDVRGEVSAYTTENQYLNPYFFGLGLPYQPVPVYLSLPRTIGIVLKVGLDK